MLTQGQGKRRSEVEIDSLRLPRPYELDDQRLTWDCEDHFARIKHNKAYIHKQFRNIALDEGIRKSRLSSTMKIKPKIEH